ncbi:MAG: helix-turn-helix transcriptional regulator [Candidatus Nanopelagicales bacterium]
MTVSELVCRNVWTVRAENMRIAQERDPGTRGAWTQAAVAAMLGIPESTYRGLETRPPDKRFRRNPSGNPSGAKNARSEITVDELVALADVLNCDVASLLAPSSSALAGDVHLDLEVRETRRGRALSVEANCWREWLSGLRALPNQDARAFDRLTSRSHLHEPSGDTRSVRPRAAAQGSGPGSPVESGWQAVAERSREDARLLAKQPLGDLATQAVRAIRQLVKAIETGAPDDVMAGEFDRLDALVTEIGSRAVRRPVET